MTKSQKIREATYRDELGIKVLKAVAKIRNAMFDSVHHDDTLIEVTIYTTLGDLRRAGLSRVRGYPDVIPEGTIADFGYRGAVSHSHAYLEGRADGAVAA